MSRYFLLFIIWTFLTGLQLVAQEIGHYESGVPPIVNYNPKEYHAMSQNWSVLQDDRGVIYVANNAGVLIYDGERWRTIGLPRNAEARTLGMDQNGVIYIGGVNELGFIEVAKGGRLQYHSLTGYIQDAQQNFGDVWSIGINGSHVYFQCAKYIFMWDGNKMRSWTTQHEFHISFLVSGHLYIREKVFGLCELVDGRIVRIPNGDIFSDVPIYGMLPFDDNHVLVVTTGRGIYKLDITDPGRPGAMTLFKTDIDEFLYEGDVSCAARLRTGTIAIGTKGKGLVLISPDGHLQSILNTDIGLQDNIIYQIYEDRYGFLWLSCSNGLSRVEYNAPLTHFSDKSGIESTIENITRYKGRLYLATQAGLFVLQPQSISNNRLAGISKNAIIKIPQVNMETWDVLNFTTGKDTALLLALDLGIYEYDDDNGTVSLIIKCYPWDIYQSNADPNRVWIGLDDGLQSLYRIDGKWELERRVAEVNEAVRKISEDEDGNLWLGTENGIIRLKKENGDGPPAYQKMTYDSTKGIPANEFTYRFIKGRTSYCASGSGLLRYNPESDSFVRDKSMPTELTDGSMGIHRITVDATGNLWVVAYELSGDKNIRIGIVKTAKDGRKTFDPTPFYEIDEDIIHSVYTEPNGITWLGGPGGLYRFDQRIDKNYNPEYSALIRRVLIGQDSTLFLGAFSNDSGKIAHEQNSAHTVVLPYSKQAITFEISAPVLSHKSTNLYRWMLEGYDEDWSDWKNKLDITYTNLSEGSYKLRVQAINLLHNKSKEANYSFTVTPPWYRTWYAYLFYVLFFVAFVYGAIRVSTRGLQKIIRERTAEVVAQKEVIEAKNKDIMASIRYAQRIQNAILPPDDMKKTVLVDAFVLYKPKDIVSGDFYWIDQLDDLAMFAAVDCTGHGVPGAFMSIIGDNGLNKAVRENHLKKAASILDSLNESVTGTLSQHGEASLRDGMDISLCVLDRKNKKLEYSGANNPLYLIRDGACTIIKADKQPIGHYTDEPKPFTNHELDLKERDVIYIFSDGYADQFGGPKAKKFMYKRFREMLVEISHKPMDEQQKYLETTFEDWKKDVEQVDDVCVIGVRI